MKNTLLFTYSTNILVRLLTVNVKKFLNPKIRKCATQFKYNSNENATPSSGTSPLGSDKEALPPAPPEQDPS